MFKSTLRVRNGEIYNLSLTNKESRSFCLAPGKLVIRIPDSNLKKIEIDSNKTTLEYESFRTQLESTKIYKELVKARTDWIKSMILTDINVIKLKKQLQDSLMILLDSLSAKISLDFIQQHPESYINSILLHSLIDIFPEVQIKKYFNPLSKSVKNNKYGEDLRYTIDSLFIGGYAPVFTQTDTNANPVKGKNFSILSVSLDSEKKPWLEAIKKDGLDWVHVSDLQERFKNEVSIRYNVYAIPDNFPIDPNRKIIEKHLNGNELLSTLEKIIE